MVLHKATPKKSSMGEHGTWCLRLVTMTFEKLCGLLSVMVFRLPTMTTRNPNAIFLATLGHLCKLALIGIKLRYFETHLHIASGVDSFTLN